MSTSRSKYDDKSFDFSHGKNQRSAEHSTRIASSGIKTPSHFGSNSQEYNKERSKGSVTFEVGGSKDIVKEEEPIENKKRE